MKRKRTIQILCITALFASSATLTHGQGVSSPEAGVNRVDEAGARVWTGEESSEMRRVMDDVTAVLSEHENVFGGSALTSNKELLEVYATPKAGPQLDVLKRSLGADFDRYVRVIEVERSLDELVVLAQEVGDQAGDTRLVEIGPDVVTNGLVVGIDESAVGADAVMSAEDITNQVPNVANLVEDLEAKGVPVRIEPAPQATFATTRGNDYSRFFGGGAIVRDRLRCSLGFPIVAKGKKGALTAGHCGNGTYKNPGSNATVGGTHTTTWTSTASRYGDWQVLTGSTYATKLFNGPLESSSVLPISRGNFGSRPVGSQLCTSGSTTGALCRFIVKGVHVTRNVDGVKVGWLTTAMHDPNFDGIGTCTGIRKGDSGGPVYYASPTKPGAVEVLGIVTASATSSGNCNRAPYFFTELKGVRQWDSQARVEGS
ncbi:MAG: hypothetical protein Q4B12_04790 [Bowdeniella nasicola]|nr:hypothetical protein [Bowdeniella nasicola]